MIYDSAIKTIEQEDGLQRYRGRLLIALELKKPYCAMEAIESALICKANEFMFYTAGDKTMRAMENQLNCVFKLMISMAGNYNLNDWAIYVGEPKPTIATASEDYLNNARILETKFCKMLPGKDDYDDYKQYLAPYVSMHNRKLNIWFNIDAGLICILYGKFLRAFGNLAEDYYTLEERKGWFIEGEK